jgi:transcriptional regulator with XRE-family HTH domain
MKTYPLPDHAADSAAQVITEFLVNRRKKLGLTIDELAKRMGIGKSTVSKIENRKWNLTLVYLLKWCYALDCNPYIEALESEDEIFKQAWKDLGRRTQKNPD